MAKIKQIKPTDRKRSYKFFPDEMKPPSWDPTWCNPEDDEKTMIAAWDCWDDSEKSSSPCLVQSSPTVSVFSSPKTGLDFTRATMEFNNNWASYNRNSPSVEHSSIEFPRTTYNQGFSNRQYQQNASEVRPQQSYASVGYPQSAANYTSVVHSPNSPFTKTLENDQIISKPAGVNGPSEKSMCIQASNARSNVDEDQVEALIKFDEEEKDMTSILKDPKILNLTSESRGLIDLDGLNDWFNPGKVGASSENIVSQGLLSNQWEQTEAGKERKNASSINDKVRYKDLLEFDLLMQK